jgi:hypothetical protein
MLVPDGQKDHRHEAFYCLPIDTEIWEGMRKSDPVAHTRNQVAFALLRASNAHRPDVIIVFQDRDLSDDDAMEACAWIRFEAHAQETIYIVPHSRSTASITSLIQRSMGVHRGRVLSVDSLVAIPVEFIGSKIVEEQP